MTDRYQILREFYQEFVHCDEPARRVGWRCRDGQLLRLEVLLEAFDDSAYPLSVLDVGCGVGTLFGYLKQTERLGDYVGIDLLPEMVSTAQTEHPDGDFRVGDVLKFDDARDFDLVVCSGTLNVRVKNHERWMKQMIHHMWELTTGALAFNLQTTRAFQFNPLSRYDEDIYHAKRGVILDWCESLTPWVTMRQDFLGEDVAFYLYKTSHKTADRLASRFANDGRSQSDRACGLAFVLLERRLPEAALKALAEVEDTDDVLNYRGLCYHRIGEHLEARKHYEAALRLNPEHEGAKLNLQWIVEKKA